MAAAYGNRGMHLPFTPNLPCMCPPPKRGCCCNTQQAGGLRHLVVVGVREGGNLGDLDAWRRHCWHPGDAAQHHTCTPRSSTQVCGHDGHKARQCLVRCVCVCSGQGAVCI